MSRKAHKRGGHLRRFKRRAPPGAMPGTLIADPESPRPIIRLMGYGPDGFTESHASSPDDITPLLNHWPVTWINVDGLGDAETIRRIGEILGLHRLALEDVLNTHQRPKVEPYGDRVFIVFREAFYTEHLETDQVSLFLGPRFVVTFQETAGDCFDPVRDRIRQSKGRIRAAGPDYLMYAILDAATDSYFPVLERYGERLEVLEDDTLKLADDGTVGAIHDAKRDLLALRRALWPARDAVTVLSREPIPGITDETRLYLRDCADHLVQLIDMLETYREVAFGLMEVYLSSINNRMNQTIKVLTLMSTIFMPLSFIAGVYGMNFNTDRSPWNMPELNWYFGYVFALSLMAATAGSLLLFFWRRGWLGRSHPRLTPGQPDAPAALAAQQPPRDQST